MSAPTPVAGAPPASSSSRTNTYPLITTPGIQVIPSSTAVGGASDDPSFPIAAIAIVAIVCGLVAIFIAYKIYVWSFRRWGSQTVVALPEARPLAGATSPPMMNRAPSSLSMAFVEDGRRSNSALGFASMSRQREASWGGDSYTGEKDWSPNGSSGTMSPAGVGEGISRGGSPIYPTFDSRTGSRGSFSGMAGMNSSGSRASMASSMTSAPRRSLFGANAQVNGPQMRNLPPTSRIAGAPHAAHTRIDIVPPLPLAPPPGTVVSTDKKTLAFAPSSGIGKDGELVNLEAPFGEGMNEHSFPPPRSRHSPSGSATPSSSTSSPHRLRGQGHLPTHSSSSSQPSTSSSSSSSHPRPPPINTSIPPGVMLGPTSPLDKLQHRIAQEARRDAKQRERSDRVRRANEGEDGTRSSFSGEGSTSGSGVTRSQESGDAYRAPGEI